VSNLIAPQVAGDEPLLSAGMDSLAAVELRNSLQAQFGLTLPVTLTFDYPNVDALAGFLCSQLEKQNSRLTVPDNPSTDAPAGLFNQTVTQLIDIVTSVLGTSIDPGQPLMEAGIDSLGGSCSLIKSVASTAAQCMTIVMF
jgi:acyl carrier protein